MPKFNVKEVKSKLPDSKQYHGNWRGYKKMHPKDPVELTFPLPRTKDGFVSLCIDVHVIGEFNRVGIELQLTSLQNTFKGTKAYRSFNEPEKFSLRLTLATDKTDKEMLLRIATLFEEVEVDFRIDELMVTDNEYRNIGASDFTGLVEV